MGTAIRGTLLTPERIIPRGIVVVEGGKIKGIEEEEPGSHDNLLDFEGCYIAPGFVDIHVHGGGGYDAMAPGGVEGLGEFLVGGGVTSFLPTTHTASREALREAVEGMRGVIGRVTGSAEPLGIHLEGPFINPEKSGAQNRAHIRPPDRGELKELHEASGGSLRMVTLAPEIEGVLEAVRWLSSEGIVPAAGHTDATHDELVAGIEAGVRHASHLFNAMGPFHHREPGAAGAALADDRVSVGLVADGFHLHPATLRLAAKAKGSGGVALISDCIAPAGLPEGVHMFGGLQVTVREGKSFLKSERLAGSTLRLGGAVRNMVRLAGFSVREAVEMASETPARIAGASNRKGRLAPGMDADIVVLSSDLSVQLTMVGGRIAHRRE
ncbi:MAG: N-acetylglucosamine-6-phosphate deacetylase [Candidatus Bathyarchaeota archaeon]|jgi:N-acetylglucosamine-6-phosphate deacetylase